MSYIGPERWMAENDSNGEPPAYPELHRALIGSPHALAALERLEIALRETLDDDDATSAAQLTIREGWLPVSEFDRVVQDAYDRVVAERNFFRSDRDLLVLHNESLANHNERLETLCKIVVERYGRVWAKDTDYYAAAEALAIKEPPEPRGGVSPSGKERP